MKNYYHLMGVPLDADQHAIRKTYRQLARQYHPDLNGDDMTGEEHFKKIVVAYEILGDPVKRALYDRQLSIQQSTATSAQSTGNNYQTTYYHRTRHSRPGDFSFMKFAVIWLGFQIFWFLLDKLVKYFHNVFWFLHPLN